MSCEEKLFRTLREHGMRVTPQRELVLSVLHDVDGYASAEEIYRRVQLCSTAMDISTVYRTLEMMQSMNMLESVAGADGQRRFALRHTHDCHSHLVCSCCGAVIETSVEPLQSLARTLRQQSGFVLAVDDLTLPGVCAQCDKSCSSDDQS